MGTKLSSILLCIVILTITLPNKAFAAQQQNEPSFFSFITNYILAYTAINSYNNKVLAAKTERVAIQQNMQLSDVSSYLLHGINQYRTSLGLYPVQSSSQTCAFAKIRAKEIAQHFNHDEFYRQVNDHTMPYTHWTRAVENIAEAPNFKEVVTLWKNSPEHALNMRDNTPYVCVMQIGNYFAYEGMRP